MRAQQRAVPPQGIIVVRDGADGLMRAAVYHGPGDVRISDVAEPGPPGASELVLRVSRASICGTDAAEYLHGPHLVPIAEPHPASGHMGPVVLGHEFVGTVVAVGPAVPDFRVGDRVVSGAGVSCGRCPWCTEGRTNLCAHYYTLGLHVDGGLAQFVKTPAAICRSVPDWISDDAAVIAQPLAVALHGLRRAGIRAGQDLLVVGAGGIGGLAIAAASRSGVGRIFAVDIERRRLDTATRFGATHVINAALEDVRSVVGEHTGGTGVDAVIEASGSPTGPQLCLEVVRRGGRVVIVGLQKEPRPLDLLSLALNEIDVVGALAHVCADDLPAALQFLGDSDLAEQLVARVISLEALVEQGLDAVAANQVDGKVVVLP